jgi:hypothetical protein
LFVANNWPLPLPQTRITCSWEASTPSFGLRPIADASDNIAAAAKTPMLIEDHELMVHGDIGGFNVGSKLSW